MENELNYTRSNSYYFRGNSDTSEKIFQLLIEDKKDELFFEIFNTMNDNVSYISDYKNMVKFLISAPEPKEKAFEFILDELSYSFFINPIENPLTQEELQLFKTFWGFDYNKEVPRLAIIFSQLPEKIVSQFIMFEHPANRFTDIFYHSSSFYNPQENHIPYKENDGTIINIEPEFHQLFMVNSLKNKKYDLSSRYMLLDNNFFNYFSSYKPNPILGSLNIIPENLNQEDKEGFLYPKDFLFLLTFESPIFFKNLLKSSQSPLEALDNFIYSFSKPYTDNNNNPILFVDSLIKKFNKNNSTPNSFWEQLFTVYNDYLQEYSQERNLSKEDIKIIKEDSYIHFFSLGQSNKINNIFSRTLGLDSNKIFKDISSTIDLQAYLHNENLITALNQNPDILFDISTSFDDRAQAYSLLENLKTYNDVLYSQNVAKYEKEQQNNPDYNFNYPSHSTLSLKTLETQYSFDKEMVLKKFKEKSRIQEFSSYENVEQLILLSTQTYSLEKLNKELFEHSYPHFFAIRENLSQQELENFLPLFQKDFNNYLLRNNTEVENKRIVKYINEQKNIFEKNGISHNFDFIDNNHNSNLSFINLMNYEFFYSCYHGALGAPLINYVNILSNNIGNIDNFSNPELLLEHKDILLQFFKESFLNTKVIKYNSYNIENIKKFHNLNLSIFQYLSHPKVLSKEELYDLAQYIETSPLSNLFYTKEESIFCQHISIDNLSKHLAILDPLMNSIEKIIMENSISFNNKKTKKLKF